jgi:formylglycine-generating enzyme required for sulfatase activity
MHRRLAFAVLLVSLPASAVTMDWAYVGDAGNAADTELMNDGTTGYGSVGYAYRISKTEVTNAQYAEFLNAKAAADPLGLYHPAMDGALFKAITRSGSSGSYTYSAVDGREDMPIMFVSFYDALRFANWLNNGQGTASTETGAYTLLGGTPIPSNGTTVTRNAGAAIFLTSEDEWYKAAYFDGTSYLDYPAGTDAQTACAAPGAAANTANCDSGDLTEVGSYTGSASPYGTFDQGGNVLEWNEAIIGSERGLRGGSLFDQNYFLEASVRLSLEPEFGPVGVGFRVASLVPEPVTGLLVMTGVLGLAGRWRRRG